MKVLDVQLVPKASLEQANGAAESCQDENIYPVRLKNYLGY